MEVILLQKVANLGNIGDKVKVKPGYGRNYLMPRGFAISWTRGAEKQVDLIKRARAAREMFDVLMTMIDRNPHGYWSAWAADPQKAELFDTVYNGAGCQRGIPGFWADGMLDLIGRERASQSQVAAAAVVILGVVADDPHDDVARRIGRNRRGGGVALRVCDADRVGDSARCAGGVGAGGGADAGGRTQH